MIFTPCKDGISHNEAEDTTLADTLPGANVLLQRRPGACQPLSACRRLT